VSSPLAELEPRCVWTHFLALTRIARPPKDEQAARAHVLAWASERGFATAVDDEGNVVVQVAATPGRGNAEPVVLQAHLDMVCERDSDSPNDPLEGRIEVARDSDWLFARGTTLGADNGIGVAAAMAVAEELEHGPLELLFTVSEEQGLAGAKALDASLITGRLLVNLDGTRDESITVGCAGSAHTFVRLPLEPEPISDRWQALSVRVTGARGGHSGGDIANGRVNAIVALGHVLSRAQAVATLRLVSLDGGVSRNAIPRDAHAVIAVEPDSESLVRASAEKELTVLRAQHEGTDNAVVVSIDPADPVAQGAGKARTQGALDLLNALPSGVVAMSSALPDVVETSTSLNVAATAEGTLTLSSMTRSANEAALEETVSEIERIAHLAGAEVESLHAYPPWRPDPNSRLLERARRTYAGLFDVEPKLEVVHGGLECAVIGSKLPGVEMISIGPDMEGLHAPGERLSISGTERFYRFLGALLDELSSP